MSRTKGTNQPKGKEKEAYVHDLFNAIARHYDRMNLIMTAGMLRYWQRAFRRQTGLKPGDEALDVACGTGELARIMAEQVGPTGRVEGIDLSEEMLAVGRRKLARHPLGDRIELVQGNALALPYEADRFACAAIGFALRNVSDIAGTVREMARVVRPGGRVISLELSKPPNPLLRGPFFLYFYHLVPLLGRWAERRFEREDYFRPYTWLPESLRHFPDQETLAGIFGEAGLVNVRYINLTGGVVCLHIGEKPGSAGAGRG